MKHLSIAITLAGLMRRQRNLSSHRAIRWGLLFLLIVFNAVLVTTANAQNSPGQYKVGDFRLGQQIDAASLSGYVCKPSDQFEGFTWCVRAGHKKEARGAFTLSESLLRSPDGRAVYINRSYSPAFFGPTEVNDDIDLRTRQLGEKPRIVTMPHRNGLPDAVIATWGKVSLEPIDAGGLALLSHDRSPNVGFFVDFLNDPTLSATNDLPVYRLGGDGDGYVWAGSYDRSGKGKLRFLAIDTSALSHPADTAAPGKETSPPNRDTRADGIQALGMDQKYDEVGWWTIGYDSGRNGCLMAASYAVDNNSPNMKVWFGFRTDRNIHEGLYLALTSRSWSFEPDKEYTLHLQLDQYGFDAHGFGVKYNDESGVYVGNATAAFLYAFQHSDGLQVSSSNGRPFWKKLSLDGSRDAVAKMQECERQAPSIAASLQNKQPAAQKDNEGPRSGTGFFVSEVGHILTNNHVTERCGSLVIRSPDGQQHDARLVKADTVNDLALILTSSKPQSIAEFESEARLGERVFVFGYPLTGFLSSSGTFTDGSVSSLEGIGDDSRMLQISAPVQPGNSGGPLMNEKGAVVGIVTSKADVLAIAKVTEDIAQNINFAIKSNIALSFMQSTDVKPRIIATVKEKTSPEIAALEKAMSVMVICDPSSKVVAEPSPAAVNSSPKVVAESSPSVVVYLPIERVGPVDPLEAGPVTAENAFTGLWVSKAQQCEDHHDDTRMVRFVAGGFQIASWNCTQSAIELHDRVATMEGQCSTHPDDNYDNPEVNQIVQLRNDNWKLSVLMEDRITNEYIKCR
jgi:serine protease Do